MLGRPEWAADPDFATYEARLANRDRLTRMLDEALMAHDTAHWLENFSGKVPVAPVHDIAQALDSGFAHERVAIREFVYPDGRSARMIANPIRVPGAELPARAAPALGADTDALLAAIQYDAARIAELKRKHVIK
jgi:crotonobetainyl-CoA:carnitine CoA-transferase CaiB-like acyl-CoA transferase